MHHCSQSTSHPINHLYQVTCKILWLRLNCFTKFKHIGFYYVAGQQYWLHWGSHRFICFQWLFRCYCWHGALTIGCEFAYILLNSGQDYSECWHKLRDAIAVSKLSHVICTFLPENVYLLTLFNSLPAYQFSDWLVDFVAYLFAMDNKQHARDIKIVLFTVDSDPNCASSRWDCKLSPLYLHPHIAHPEACASAGNLPSSQQQLDCLLCCHIRKQRSLVVPLTWATPPVSWWRLSHLPTHFWLVPSLRSCDPHLLGALEVLNGGPLLSFSYGNLRAAIQLKLWSSTPQTTQQLSTREKHNPTTSKPAIVVCEPNDSRICMHPHMWLSDPPLFGIVGRLTCGCCHAMVIVVFFLIRKID